MLALDLGLVSRLSELLWCKAQKILPAQGPPGLSSGKKKSIVEHGDSSACARACTVQQVKRYSDHEQERKRCQLARKSLVTWYCRAKAGTSTCTEGRTSYSRPARATIWYFALRTSNDMAWSGSYFSTRQGRV